MAVDGVAKGRLDNAIEAKFDELVGEHFAFLVRNYLDQAPEKAIAEFLRGLDELRAARLAAFTALGL